MFVQAGATIRRVLDPSHRDYGEVVGYYDRIGEFSKRERAIWTDHLDGKLSLDDAIKRIAEECRGQG